MLFIKKGSTGKIVFDIHSQLEKEGYQSYVYYGRGKNNSEKNIQKIAPEIIMKGQSLRSRITGYAYSGCYLSTKKLIKDINELKPDLVHLHCLNGYFVNIYKLIEYLKRSNLPTVLTLHAEFMHTAGCGYAFECERWKTGCYRCPQFKNGRPQSWLFDRSSQEWKMMKNAFEGFDNLIICPVSHWLESRAKQSPFMKSKKFQVIENGLDTDIFCYHSDTNKRKELGIAENDKVVIHVTPDFTSQIKGGKYVLKLAEKTVNEAIRYIIVGYNGNEKSLPKNVIPIEHTNNQVELAELYSIADVTLLTSRKETFSMVCAESLSCGTPVVGFEAGAPETISLEEYSTFVPFNNIGKLEKEMRAWCTREVDHNMIQSKAQLRYEKKIMVKNYLSVYKELL